MKITDKLKNRMGIMQRISLSGLFTVLVIAVVLVTSVVSLLTFVKLYRKDMEENAITSSEQAVVQVKNTVANYTEDMSDIMQMICENIQKDEEEANEFFGNLLKIRPDVVAVTSYDLNGKLQRCWSGGQKLKEKYLKNLSYVKDLTDESDGMLNITKPHVESLFVDYYPWVVTISRKMKDASGNEIQVAVDISFYNIASYVDEVGIGQHGYCYIADDNGSIVYHPQQQLIYAELKEEKHDVMEDGSYIKSNVIYTVKSLENCDWHIVGVCYVDEMITSKVERVVSSLVVILVIVLFGTCFMGSVFSRWFSKPITQLVTAMSEFEGDNGEFVYQPVHGTQEIDALSDSFEHMVIRNQKLMEKVRQEEISLRKTELKALQAQINPHFLYNTLDAIAWLCEEERNEDAVKMVNALARLFRISISRGHELIPIEKELQHAQSYLQIQNFRYKNQFMYSFDVDETCLSYLCNKITLQPIIENAIYHGMDRMVDEGMIKIGIHQDPNRIIFTVEDNGVGMTEEQCREVLKKEPGDRAGIGIKNVNDRIKIYFGDEYGLTIQSELDVGTCVTITMPKVTERSYEEKQ
ncbi:MAG: sensor histidine kinase [Lachnospiraceae bacterium]|nr:sensor histidine kinase [Lachnospiraceae bacterium]